MALHTADRITGTFIDEVTSIEEGLELIEKHERQDRKDGCYEENFYDVVDDNHCSMIGG